jgi:hypothetical protein
MNNIVKMNVKNIILLLFIAITFLLGGCKYNWVIPEEVPVIDPDEPISFSQQILPIFSEKNCTACHDGTPAPDLREANAYASVNSERFINRTTPEESSIYTAPHPDGGHPVKYSAVQAALVLIWIQQGAENN